MHKNIMQHVVASAAAAVGAGIVYGVNWWRRRLPQQEPDEKLIPQHRIFGGVYTWLSADFSGFVHLDEIYRRLVRDDERELFRQCLAHLDEIILMSRTLTLEKTEALQNVTYAYNHADQMRQLFAKLASLAYKNDPSRTKRTAIRENSSRVLDATADMLAQIAFTAQELVRSDALRHR